MSESDDGGTAFPTEPRYNAETTDAGYRQHFYAGHYGMSLRDYFAAKVLQGLCVQNSGMQEPQYWNTEVLAQQSYALADAMLKERAK